MPEKITRAKATSVRAYPHPSDSRANIPTAELESFARPQEKRPATVRYPRDPTLDPQLVWKGKDEQDAHDLEVPAVPIYIQETIDPLALVDESDVDLLVVFDRPEDRRERRVEIRHLLADIPFAKDILVAATADLERPLHGSALADAVKHGVVVYER